MIQLSLHPLPASETSAAPTKARRSPGRQTRAYWAYLPRLAPIDASDLAGISLVGDRHRLTSVSRVIINVTGRR